MDNKINPLIIRIQESYKGVRLAGGVSWREANVLDNYGTIEERNVAKAQDEQDDWTKVPKSLIEDLRYQSVIPFLDANGLKFYLPPIMIYTLTHYASSQSLITHSIIYNLNDKKTAQELQSILTLDQKACVINFLSICLEIGDDYFDITKLPEKLEKYWIGILPAEI